jgi:hypothetical protein
MVEIPKDMKSLLFGRGARWMARCGLVFGCVSWASLIVGVIGDATNKKLGLEPTNWFLISIGFVIAAFWSWLTAYFAAKES